MTTLKKPIHISGGLHTSNEKRDTCSYNMGGEAVHRDMKAFITNDTTKSLTLHTPAQSLVWVLDIKGCVFVAAKKDGTNLKKKWKLWEAGTQKMLSELQDSRGVK
jgi:hypothetical protein